MYFVENFCKGLVCSGHEVLERGWMSEEQPEPQEEDRKGMLGRL